MRTRTSLALLVLTVTLGGRAAAQPSPAPAQAPSVLLEADANNARETRDRLTELLRQYYPPALAQVLRLDPTLLANEAYLKPYPVLAAYLAQHPEIARGPAFFLGEWYERRDESVEQRRLSAAEGLMTGMLVLTGLVTFMGLVAWLIKTAFDHRRWLRLSRIQTEAHTKVLDRLTSNEDLLAYIQTPAGRRFLESAPLSLEGGPVAAGAPVSRILWSVQAGAVAAAVGVGFLFVSRRMAADPTGFADASPALFLMGSVVMAAGIGFILSAGAAYALSRRLGLLQAPESTNA